jgi:hypothetical protein
LWSVEPVVNLPCIFYLVAENNGVDG